MRGPVLFFLAALSAISFAQKKPAAQLTIEKQIARYVQGMQKKDIKAVTSVMIPDFRVVSQAGITARGADVIDQLRNLFKQVKKLTLSCKIHSFKMEQGNAHLVSHNVMEIEVLDPQGNIGTIRSDSTSDEIWVPADHTFKISSSKQLTNKVTLNGRPVKGGG